MEVLKNRVLLDLEPALHALIRSLLKEAPDATTWRKSIQVIACICFGIGVSPVRIVLAKIRLNSEKYPVETGAQVESHRTVPKYTELIHLTSYKGDHMALECPELSDIKVSGSEVLGERTGSGTAMEELTTNEGYLHEEIFKFSNERGWLAQYNNTGLSISLFAEFGEVCSVLEYCKPGKVGQRVKNGAARELADVIIYLFHVARVNRFTLSD